MKYIASCSFGKDSLGAILLALEHGEPLDEAVYCEVMFDKHISGEVPEHRDFIYTRGIPALECMGIKVTVLRGRKTYVICSPGALPAAPRRGCCAPSPSAAGALSRETASCALSSGIKRPCRLIRSSTSA